MFASIVSVVLTLSPVSAPSASCDACGLTRPTPSRVTSERLAAAPAFRGVLVAQAELPPPPLPDSNVKANAGGSARELELQRKIDDLNHQARMIDTNWPPGYIALGYLGYVIAPSGVVMGASGMLLGFFYLSQGLPNAALIVAISAGVFAIGLAGVAMIVYAFVQGSAATDAAKKRREEIVEERQHVEEELRQLRNPSQAERARPAQTLVTVLTF